MSIQTWMQTLISAQVDGAALASSTTPTSLLPQAAKYTFAPNAFQPGTVLRVIATGRLSTLNPTPGNITFDLRMGSTVIANGGAIALNTSVAKTNVPWWMEWILTCRAIGGTTTTTFMPLGSVQSEALIGSATNAAGGNTSLLIPVGAPAVGTGVDVSVTQQLDLFATFSISNAANSITLHQFVLQQLN